MKKSPAIFAGVLICMFLAGFGAKESVSQACQSVTGNPSFTVDRSFGEMPLYFIRNEGQVDSRVGYYIQGKDKTIYFTSEGLTYMLSEKSPGEDGGKDAVLKDGRRSMILRDRGNRTSEPRSRWVVKLDFVGANRDVRPMGEEKTEAVISYFKGKQDEWKTGLPTYSKIAYRELWPGIDLVYNGTVDKLKYEFIVYPGADPSRIRLAYRGANSVEVNKEGRLEVVTPAGGFEDDVPAAWQDVDGKQREVPISYKLESEAEAGNAEPKNPGISPIGSAEVEAATSLVHAYGFYVGNYDRSQTLFLDPAVLVYCGYIGGSGWDSGWDIALDSAGNAYITGNTASSELSFPVAAGPDLTYGGGLDDAFVAKVNSSGTALSYCGYIGGSADDNSLGIAVDGSGNAHITGWTYSTEATFPVTVGPDLTHNDGDLDGFVAKVNSSGTALSYCGYIGGSGGDGGYGIALDGAGNAYVTGHTGSTEATFPVTVGPDPSYNGGYDDAFVAKVSSSGNGLFYCGYIGGSSTDVGNGIAVDSAGNAYVIGYTDSTEATFPVTFGPDLSHNGDRDAFVAKVKSSGNGFSYCGYIGGTNDDSGMKIVLDNGRNVYATGRTASTEASLPVKIGPDLTLNGVADVFVAKMNSSGTGLYYCGYIGGSGDEYGAGIAVDSSGNACVSGFTSSTEATFPVTDGPDLTYNGGLWDAFVAKVNSSGAGLSYCCYIGGSETDAASGIAVDSAGNALITGRTYSTQTTFPVTVGPDLTFNGGDCDAFVAKINSVTKDDILGTWDSSGVWYRNTATGDWVSITSPANLVSAGDLDGDSLDDLVGVWSTGLWVRYSKTTTWTKLSTNLPTSITSGYIDGDGREDVLASYASGVWCRLSATGAWGLMSSSPASLIAAGDIDGDSRDDLIGVWDTGVWVRNSSSGSWTKISSNLPTDIASGDMNGDGRDDVVGTWASGVWYCNSKTEGWVLMSSEAAIMVAAGDIDGDGKKDLIGVWATGLWMKKSQTGAWLKISAALPRDIDAGLFRTGETAATVGFASPVLIYTDAPGAKGVYEDCSNEGPGGSKFKYDQEENLIPFESNPKIALGPGDPGLQFEVQENLVPRENQDKGQEKGTRET